MYFNAAILVLFETKITASDPDTADIYVSGIIAYWLPHISSVVPVAFMFIYVSSTLIRIDKGMAANPIFRKRALLESFASIFFA